MRMSTPVFLLPTKTTNAKKKSLEIKYKYYMENFNKQYWNIALKTNWNKFVEVLKSILKSKWKIF